MHGANDIASAKMFIPDMAISAIMPISAPPPAFIAADINRITHKNADIKHRRSHYAPPPATRRPPRLHAPRVSRLIIWHNYRCKLICHVAARRYAPSKQHYLPTHDDFVMLVHYWPPHSMPPDILIEIALSRNSAPRAARKSQISRVDAAQHVLAA